MSIGSNIRLWFYNFAEFLLFPERCENCNGRIWADRWKETKDMVKMCERCYWWVGDFIPPYRRSEP